MSIRQAVEQIMDWNDAIPFQKAAEDAELLMREGKYDIAVDRILTAFSDYTKHLLAEHDVPFDADDRIRTILHSAGEIIDAMAHTDGQPVGKREGQFALGLINLVVEYIDDVEEKYTYE